MAINFPSKSRIESLNKLAEGGEATIYEYSRTQVIKVFKPSVDLARKEQKVKCFIAMRGKFPKNVIGPEEEVTVRGKFVGYAMRKLVDSEDLHMLTKPKYLAAARLTNQDVLRIITSLGEDLGKIHEISFLHIGGNAFWRSFSPAFFSDFDKINLSDPLLVIAD